MAGTTFALGEKEASVRQIKKRATGEEEAMTHDTNVSKKVVTEPSFSLSHPPLPPTPTQRWRQDYRGAALD